MYTTDLFEEINVMDPMSDDHKTLRYSLLPSMMLTYDYNAKRNIYFLFIKNANSIFYK